MNTSSRKVFLLLRKIFRLRSIQKLKFRICKLSKHCRCCVCERNAIWCWAFIMCQWYSIPKWQWNGFPKVWMFSGDRVHRKIIELRCNFLNATSFDCQLLTPFACELSLWVHVVNCVHQGGYVFTCVCLSVILVLLIISVIFYGMIGHNPETSQLDFEWPSITQGHGH